MPSVIVIGSGLVGAATGLRFTKPAYNVLCMIKSTLCKQSLRTRQLNSVPQEVGGAPDVLESLTCITFRAVMIQAGGLRVLRSLGLLDECIEAGALLPYTVWAKIDGSAPVVADARILNKTAGETDTRLLTPLHILRSTLHNILMKECHKFGIKTLVNKKLVDVKQDESVTADLLIGADGIHSPTRRNVFGEALKANFTGEMGHIGVVNIKEHGITFKEKEEFAFYIDRDRKRFVANFKVTDEIAAVRVNLEATTRDGYTYWRRCSRNGTKRRYWLLTGLEDAGTLLALLRHYPEEQNWQKALSLYSKIRVQRGTAAANQARSMRERGMAASIFGGGLNHLFFRLAMTAANAGMFTLYTIFDCDAEVAKAIENDSN
ncbi:FAD/NAD(P)-binding domain-containing protein [Rhizoclosmatium globosum]|uniref:FAD/NAD(P)-binding domain-containing protein n=1 Tax=Rhizoclosmatium globosum TaxID=329046 RepID=A0A1Y2BTZ6_9FUNG|nr:FAD/NAD(P)-binding domain-containing protein [Rhizoclosmatium globosum]|eukprot:ORY38221.1 FAD/NAD(P)-binding domain-containing protein [Rhizoclosmatium globosum]